MIKIPQDKNRGSRSTEYEDSQLFEMQHVLHNEHKKQQQQHESGSQQSSVQKDLDSALSAKLLKDLLDWYLVWQYLYITGTLVQVAVLMLVLATVNNTWVTSSM